MPSSVIVVQVEANGLQPSPGIALPYRQLLEQSTENAVSLIVYGQTRPRAHSFSHPISGLVTAKIVVAFFSFGHGFAADSFRRKQIFKDN